jgi:precorrin-6A/cobalt-precorrin-6A reductase
MRSSKILILGGTSEARDIAATLIDGGFDVTTSLAGVTTNPLLPSGKTRSGGFGGAVGLRDYFTDENVDVLIDATHPYAAIISQNAFEAVKNTHIELLRFERPAWTPVSGDVWIDVASLSQAATQLPENACAFITTGRKDLTPFLARADISGVIRTVEPPTEVMPPHWRVILDRPPHALQNELALFEKERFTHIVTKNAGSSSTRAKLDAARFLGLPVVMVQRPLKPPCETFSEIPVLTKRLGTSGRNG